jgi:hypothetical protein
MPDDITDCWHLHYLLHLFGGRKDNLEDAAIYIGVGQFVISYKAYGTIKTLNMTDSVAQQYYVGAVRISEQPTPPLSDRVVEAAKSHLGEQVTHEQSAAFVSELFAEEGVTLSNNAQEMSNQGSVDQ